MKNKLLTKLISWLAKPGNSYAKIAVALGYRDSAPIRQWINRESIPTYQEDRVKKIIGEK